MRADRLLAIVMLLQRRGKMTAAALADELEVSRRTILRDVEALSMAGVPLYAEGGHGGGIALDENYRTSLTGLTEVEVRALSVEGNQQILDELGLGEALERTRRKLAAALPAQHQAAADHMRQRIYIDPVWWWHDAQPLPCLQDLQEAIYQDRCVRVRYERYTGEVAERVLEPYSLVAKSSTWYLVAKREGEFRTYRVSRMHAVVMLDRSFQRDPAFDLMRYWHDHLDEFAATFAEYEFTLRIHPGRIKFAQWLTPGRNTILGTGDDGWSTVRFALDSPELAQMLVFGLAGQCEVVAPSTLREAVLNTCRELLARQVSSGPHTAED